MKLFGPMYERALVWARSPQAPAWLTALSFAEAVIFPVPPEVMLAPMALSQPKRALRFASLSLLGSLAGALLGYMLGHYAYELVKPLFASLGWIEKIEEQVAYLREVSVQSPWKAFWNRARDRDGRDRGVCDDSALRFEPELLAVGALRIIRLQQPYAACEICVGLERQLRTTELHDAPRHQPGSDQQRHRQRDLDHDESLAQPAEVEARRAPRLILEDVVQIDPRGLDRRCDTRDQRCEDSYAHHIQEHRHIEDELHEVRTSRQRRSCRSVEQVDRPPGECRSEQRTCAREHERLGEERERHP